MKPKVFISYSWSDQNHQDLVKHWAERLIADADELREKVKEGHEKLNVKSWHNFHFNRNFWDPMNMDKLDTLK